MGISLKQIKSSIATTYSELYDLVINSKLVPGATYKLTDYRSANFTHGQDYGGQNWTNEINNGEHDLMPGTKDQSFRVEAFENVGDSIYIKAIALQSDGKIIIGGEFYMYQGKVVNNIARLNTDGTLDTTFQCNGFNETVRTIAVDMHDDIIVGGDFTSDSSGNYQLGRIAKLNKNGDLDLTFPGQGFDGIVRVIKIDNYSRIWVGGDFTTFTNDTSYEQYNIICLSNDKFGGPVGIPIQGLYSFDGIVYTIELDNANNKIFIGGDFTTYNSNPALKMLKLNLSDLSVDSFFDTSTMFNSEDTVYALAIDNDTNYIYIGGQLTTCYGDPVHNLIRNDLGNTNGFDTGFSNTLSTYLDIVYSLKLQNTDDGKKLLVKGEFSSFNGTIVNNLIRLNLPFDPSDGTLDTEFISIVSGDNTVLLDSNNKILTPSYRTLLRLNSNRVRNQFFTPNEIHYGATESLVLVAKTQNEFETEVFSEQYPQDIIEYNPLVNSIAKQFSEYFNLKWPDIGGDTGEPQDQDGILYKLYTGTFNNGNRFVTRYEGSYFEDSKKTDYDNPNLVYEYVFDKNQTFWSELTPFAGTASGSICFNGRSGLSLDTDITPWNIENADFTFEWFQYTTGDYSNTNRTVFDYGSGKLAAYLFDGEITILINGGSTYNIGIGDITNTWTHFAITREYDAGQDLYNWFVFKDGEVLDSFNLVSSFSQGGPLTIGYSLNYETREYNYFEGNITNFRVNNSYAIYTEAFTAPTASLDPSFTPGNTVLCLSVNNETDFLVDYSKETLTVANVVMDHTITLNIVSNPYQGPINSKSGVYLTGNQYQSTFDGGSETSVIINTTTYEATSLLYDGTYYVPNQLELKADSKNVELGGTLFNDISTDDLGNTFYDDDAIVLQLPFSINFNDEPWDIVYLSTNGIITFDAAKTECCFPQSGWQDILYNSNNVMPKVINIPGIFISINGWSGGDNSCPYIYLGNSGEGGPIQFGHSFYPSINFVDHINEYYYSLEGVYENVKPGINHVTNNWSYDEYTDTNGTPKSRLRISSDGLTVEFLDLNYKNFVDNKYYETDPYVYSYVSVGEQYGHITRRFDTERNIDVPFDFRNIMYRRYEIDFTRFERGQQYVGLLDKYSIYINDQHDYTNSNYFKATGYTSKFFVFDNYPLNDSFLAKNIKWEDNPGPDFILDGNLTSGQYENNVFLGSLSDTTIKSSFYHNTIIGNFYNSISNSTIKNIVQQNIVYNTIGVGFQYNLILGNLESNKIGDSFDSNLILGGFSSNIIESNFDNNSLIDQVSNNKIGDSFNYNNIIGTLMSNTIDSNFEANQIYGDFRYNTIRSYFNGHNKNYEINAGNNLVTTITSTTASIFGDFEYNIIGNSFQANRINGNFIGNVVGNNFQYNIIGGTATDNKIGNSTKYNKIGDYLQSNTIGNYFGLDYNQGNNIGDYFYNNTISDNFHTNEIENDFQSNDVKTDFQEWNLTNAYYVYTDINCTIFRDANSTTKLSYVDGDGLFAVTVPDAD